MNTWTPGRERYEHTRRGTRPPGWTDASWATYVEDSDGGRAVCRSVVMPPPDTTPTIAEILSRGDAL